jgi:hypothetical protein
MTAGFAVGLGRRARRGALGALLVSALVVVLLTACGITLSSGDEETEIFKRLTVEGNRRLGEDLTMRLEYSQPYNIEIGVVCELLASNPPSTATLAATATPQGTPPGTPTVPPIPKPEPTSEGWQTNLLDQRLPSNEHGGLVGEVTPVAGVLEISFFAPELPGDYEVRCYTPDAPENEITLEFTIAPLLAPE